MKIIIRYFSMAVLMVLLLLSVLTPLAFAEEAPQNYCAPDAASVEAYKADGSFSQRQAFFESLGLDKTDSGLIAQAKAAEEGTGKRSVPGAWKTGMGTTGEAKILLVRVDFPDEKFGENDTEAALHKIAFGSDTEGTPYESLAAYYTRSSYGKLNISGQTASYTAKNNRDSYTLSIDSLFAETLTALDESGMDFSQFDGNRDERIDGVYIHFAGEDKGWGSRWWSYKTAYFGAPLTLDGVTLSDYVMLHQNSANGAHTLIHETGHMLGLADYYSYVSQTFENGIRTPDMMDGSVGDHNGFSKWLLGWIGDVTQVNGDSEKTTELKLTPISGDKPAKIATAAPSDNGMFSEYFLVQYDEPGNVFQPPGFSGGFRIFYVNATLDAYGQDFINRNKTPAEPKLIEAVCFKDETGAMDSFYTDEMRLAPDTTPDSSFFGGKYKDYTGAVFEALNIKDQSLNIRFEHDPPAVPELLLTSKSPMDNLTNVPSFVFTTNIPAEVNLETQADSPVVLEGDDNTRYPMHVRVNGQEIALGLADNANIPELLPNHKYTLVFPEKYFNLGQDINSKALRFPVKTGSIPGVLASGVLDRPSPDYLEKTDLMAASDGRLFRFAARHKSVGESTKPYFDAIQLYVTDSDFKTRTLSIENIPNPERYTAIKGVMCKKDILALALYNENADETDIYKVSAKGEILAEPDTLKGNPSIFACGDGVVAWQIEAAEEQSGVKITTLDFKTEPRIQYVKSDASYAGFKVFSVDKEHYSVYERALYGGWTSKKFLSLYDIGKETPSWKTEVTTASDAIGAAAQNGKTLLFESSLGADQNNIASTSSRYYDLQVSTFDEKGNQIKKAEPVGQIRSGINSNISVKGSDAGIVVESLFTAPISPYLSENNDTECRDYLFMDTPVNTVKKISGRCAGSGVWQGDKYVIPSQDLASGAVNYTQLETLFKKAPLSPIDPEKPENPTINKPSVQIKSEGNSNTGIISDSRQSAWIGLVLLSGLLIGCVVYKRKNH